MLNKEDFQKLLKDIASTGGASENMLELLKNLQDDFDERAGELERYVERADEKPPEGFKTWQEAMKKIEGERDDIKQRYIDRFFEGGKAPEKHAEPDGDEAEAEDENTKSKSYDDLFKASTRKEGK